MMPSESTTRPPTPRRPLPPGRSRSAGRTQSNSWDLAFELISSYAEVATKWEQPPDLSNNGVDVNDTEYPGILNPPPYLLADDFKCVSTGPLTHITIWGSWTNDYETPQNARFTLSIHSDIPAHGTNHSRPGPLLWQQTFLPGEYLHQWAAVAAYRGLADAADQLLLAGRPRLLAG